MTAFSFTGDQKAVFSWLKKSMNNLIIVYWYNNGLFNCCAEDIL
jgi:hypothetical protein